MARSSLLWMIVLATIGYSAGIVVRGAFDDPEIQLIENKTSEYDSHADNMAAIIGINKDFIDAQKLNSSDGSNPIEPFDDEDNCRQKTIIKKPYVMKINNVSSNIVQLHNFEQKIKWIECKDNRPPKPCFGSVYTPDIQTPYKTETQCGEKYGAISLYVYDPQYNEVRYKVFPVPVACVCRFKRNEA